MTTRAAAPASSATTWALLASILALAWLGGAALPMAWGWLPALGVAVLAAVVARGRLTAAPPSGWALALRARAPIVRIAMVYATGFAAVVFASVLAGAVGHLLIAFPGATFAAAFVLVATLALDRVGRGAAWAVPPIVVGLALIGARFEADAPDARGAAYSGPVLGIHPFQSTAIVIDGIGPFDLPINDFVEPTGGRGYDPPALAVAIELALHRIAEIEFAAGPARARTAFADAKVEFLSTPPVRERLDRPIPAADDPRFVVHSGTTGQRSRVEFVCPGRRDDPRGPRPETIMSRTCPTKYASEASAGLGVTGRWPGYVELRGNERVGLAKLLGVTRVEGSVGAPWLARERWLYAVIVLGCVLAGLLIRRGAPATATIAAAAPIALPMIVLVVIAAVMGSDFDALAARATPPSWTSALGLETWKGALVWPAAAAMLAWSEPELRPGGRAAGRGIALLAALFVVWLASTDLDAARWLSPAWWNAEAPLESAVVALADAVEPAIGLPILELEAITAAAIAAPLVVACIAVVRGVGAAATAAAAPDPDLAATRGRWVVVAVVLLAVALGVSRKTGGGVALIPAATGVALVLGSALRRIAARGIWPRTHVSPLSIVAHLGWLAPGLALVAGSFPEDGGDPVRMAYFVLAVVAVLLPLVVGLPDPDPPGAPGGRSSIPPA